MKVVHRMTWKKSDECIAGNWGITSEWTAELLNLRNGNKDEENLVWIIAEIEMGVIVRISSVSMDNVFTVLSRRMLLNHNKN